MIAIVANSSNVSSSKTIEEKVLKPYENEQAKDSSEELKQIPLSELFKKQVGSWDCTICYVNNKKDSIKCISCETPQPGFESQVEAEKAEEVKKAAAQAPTFSFGFKSADNKDVPPTIPTSGFSFTLPSTGLNFGTVNANQTLVPSTDLKERARQLQLPDNFYAYATNSEHVNCVGCRGCDPDTFVFKTPEETLSPIDPDIFKQILSKHADMDEVKAAWSSGS